MSRVTTLKHGATKVVGYDYNGVGQVVGTDYLEPEIRWDRHEGGGAGSYPDLDNFNRVVKSRWTAYHTSTTDFYHVDLGYDENSNIKWADDNVHVGFDVEYGIDDVDRLTLAKEGNLSGTSISGTPSRSQAWELDHVGNWDRDTLDLDGDGIFTGTGEWDDCREHNQANEIESRNLDCAGALDFEPDYDAAGNLIDDKESYKYVYDAFYRLRKILNQSNELVSEHRYNGLGHRIAVLVDTDEDGEVDDQDGDEWEHLVYDERWRLVAKFWPTDASPHQEFLHHQAGLDGHGGSSYIDLVVLRDRDTDDNGSLDERIYYCQNWRADVSALVSSDGEMLEWVKYSAYGVPFGLPAGDTDSDGDRDSDDQDEIAALNEGALYDVRGDMNLDGTVDSADQTLASGEFAVEMGRGVLSQVDSAIGFDGYEEFFPGAESLWCTGARTLLGNLGIWAQRAGVGSIAGLSLYSYAGTRARVQSAEGSVYGRSTPDEGTPSIGIDSLGFSSSAKEGSCAGWIFVDGHEVPLGQDTCKDFYTHSSGGDRLPNWWHDLDSIWVCCSCYPGDGESNCAYWDMNAGGNFEAGCSKAACSGIGDCAPFYKENGREMTPKEEERETGPDILRKISDICRSKRRE